MSVSKSNHPAAFLVIGSGLIMLDSILPWSIVRVENTQRTIYGLASGGL